MLFRPSLPYLARNATTRSGSLTPGGFRNNPFTTEKIAAFAPIPSASVSTATIVNPGDFVSIRNAYRTSWVRFFMVGSSIHKLCTTERQLLRALATKSSVSSDLEVVTARKESCLRFQDRVRGWPTLPPEFS